MRNNMTDREKKHLRELVGEDGQAAHYFVPAVGDLHMRSYNKSTPSKKVQQKVLEQVRKMRRAAAPDESLTPILTTVNSVVALQRKMQRVNS